MHRGKKGGDCGRVYGIRGNDRAGQFPKGNSQEALTLQGINTIDRSINHRGDRTLYHLPKTVLYSKPSYSYKIPI